MEYSKKEKASFNLRQLFGQHSITALVCKLLAFLMVLIGLVVAVAWWVQSGFMFLFIIFFLGMCIMAFLCYALGHVIEMNFRNYEASQQILDTMTVMGADPEAFYLTEAVYQEELEGLDIEGDPEQFAFEEPAFEPYSLEAPEEDFEPVEEEAWGEEAWEGEPEPEEPEPEEFEEAEEEAGESFEEAEEAWAEEPEPAEEPDGTVGFDGFPDVAPPGMSAAEFAAANSASEMPGEDSEEGYWAEVPGEGSELEPEPASEPELEPEPEPELEPEPEPEPEPDPDGDFWAEEEEEPEVGPALESSALPGFEPTPEPEPEAVLESTAEFPAVSASFFDEEEGFSEDEEDEDDEDEEFIVVGRHSRH